MLQIPRSLFSQERISEFKDKVIQASNANDEELVKKELQPLLRIQARNKEAALCLVEIVDGYYLPQDSGREVLESVYKAHSDDLHIVSLIGSALEAISDIDELNREPPEHEIFEAVVSHLEQHLVHVKGTEQEEPLLCGLATAARMMSRQYDDLALSCYRRLIEIEPCRKHYYTLGLHCKTRGLFKEGMLANQKAKSLSDESLESYEWNLGICATGAGEGAIALEVWQQLGNKIRMGRFDLPEGRYPQCKVKLSQYPLAERRKDNDYPGLEETIWIERLSPCHGIIRSVLFQNLGVDYGDVILLDGAPITYHKYDDKDIPVFPHLTTLRKQNYHFFDFAGTQEEAGRINMLSQDLEKDAIVYSHTENFRTLCSSCWKDPDTNHQTHDTEQKHVITGRIAAPNDMQPAHLLEQLDKAVRNSGLCKIYSPDLCRAAGFNERAEVEARRFKMLGGN